MASNIVLQGDYKGKAVMCPTGKPYISTGFRKKLYLNKDTVESYEVVTEESRKSAASGVARGLIGATLLGPAGALAGGMSAKNKASVTLIITFKDGKKSLIEVNGLIYKELVGLMM